MQAWDKHFWGASISGPSGQIRLFVSVHHYSMSQNVMYGTKMLPQKQQSRRRRVANGFALSTVRAVFSDGIR